jgi:hypothetical protein
MSEQMRKEFEAFAERWRYDLSENENGFYENATTQRVFDSFAWAWTASRQSLAVKLSDICDLHPQKMLERDVIKSLDTAGVRYE